MKLQAFHKLSYGLYIIASSFEGKKTGYVANTVFQVTSKPPMLAISCHKDNFSANIIQKSGIFSVSVLSKDPDMKLIGEFGFSSGNEVDKFKSLNETSSKTGAPIVLNDTVAWFDCEVKESIDLGSHWLIIGEVVDTDFISDEDPLTYAYYREQYKMFSPKNSPTYIEADKLKEEKKASDSKKENENKTQKYVCAICGYTYDPEEGDPTIGVPPGTPFEDLPEDYSCPICNASKEYFKPA